MAQDDAAWLGKPEPDIAVIQKIARKHLPFVEKDSFRADLTRTSRHGKFYTILKNNKKAAYMHVVLGPLSKSIQNDVSTVQWLQKNTTLGIGSAFSSEDSEENELGYNWKLDQASEGELLGPEMWREMTWSAKEKFVRSLACGHAQLLEPSNRLQGIGDIYFGVNPASMPRAAEASLQGETNSKSFYVSTSTFDGSMTSHFHTAISESDGTNAYHRPYYKSSEWLLARLDGIIKEQSTTVALVPLMDPEYELEPHKLTVALAKRLRAKLPEVFFPEIDTVNETVLWNTWLCEDHFMVSKEGDISQIFGFAHSHTVPLWRCYELPEVILGRNQEFTPALGAPDYWEHLLQQEKTKLRRIYLDTIEELHPGFKMRMKQYQRFIDFAYAVVECQMPEAVYIIKDWLDACDHGIYYNVRDRMLGPWNACANCGDSTDCRNGLDPSVDSDGSLPPLEGEDDWQDERETSFSPESGSDENDESSSEDEDEDDYASVRENDEDMMEA